MNGDLNDASGFARHGLMFGGLTATTDRFGRSGRALAFDGLEARGELPGVSTDNLTAGTISLWVRRALFTTRERCGRLDMDDVSPFSCQYNVLAKQGPDGPTLRFQYGGPLTANDKFYFTLAGEGALWVTFDSEALGDWHHYAFVWNAGLRSIYLDGVLLGADNAGSTSTLTGTLFLGHNSGTTYGFREHFEGAMDDLKVYSRALSAAEVTSLVFAKDNPANAGECKNDGWSSFGFENQGRCIQYVNTGKDSRTSNP